MENFSPKLLEIFKQEVQEVVMKNKDRFQSETIRQPEIVFLFRNHTFVRM